MTGTAAGYRVRRAKDGDAAGCARVYVDSWRTAYAGLVPDRVLVGMSYQKQEREWAAAITGRTGPSRWGAVYVAETGGGEIAGLTTCGAARQPNYDCQAEIFTLYLAEDYQGVGLGRRLLCTALSGLRDGGCRSALVWVLAGNPARFFYGAMGGRKIAEKQEKLWGRLLDQEAYAWPDLAKFLDGNGPCSGRR